MIYYVILCVYGQALRMILPVASLRDSTGYCESLPSQPPAYRTYKMLTPLYKLIHHQQVIPQLVPATPIQVTQVTRVMFTNESLAAAPVPGSTTPQLQVAPQSWLLQLLRQPLPRRRVLRRRLRRRGTVHQSAGGASDLRWKRRDLHGRMGQGSPSQKWEYCVLTHSHMGLSIYEVLLHS